MARKLGRAHLTVRREYRLDNVLGMLHLACALILMRIAGSHQFQNVRSCCCLTKARKYLFYAVTVHLLIHIGHCIHYERDVIAQVVCAARRRFHADAGGNANQDRSLDSPERGATRREVAPGE